MFTAGVFFVNNSTCKRHFDYKLPLKNPKATGKIYTPPYLITQPFGKICLLLIASRQFKACKKDPRSAQELNGDDQLSPQKKRLQRNKTSNKLWAQDVLSYISGWLNWVEI